MSDINLHRVTEYIQAATDEVDALCSGKRRWTMRIPANLDTDSDIVISRALKVATQLVDEVGRLHLTRAELADEVQALRSRVEQIPDLVHDIRKQLAKDIRADKGDWISHMYYTEAREDAARIVEGTHR